MIPSVSLFDHDRQILQRLQRRDRQALLLYVFSGAVIVVAGEAAAFAARIIAVADAFDALGSNRSYRRGVSADQALNIIAQATGSRFDPEVVAAIARKPLREALLAAHGKMP